MVVTSLNSPGLAVEDVPASLRTEAKRTNDIDDFRWLPVECWSQTQTHTKHGPTLSSSSSYPLNGPAGNTLGSAISSKLPENHSH